MDMQDMQQPEQPAEAGFFSPEDQSTPENAGQFTINSDQIESSIKEQMDKQQSANLDRVLTEGNELLFGKETHYQLMDQLKNSQNLSADLGNGAFGVMSILIKEGGNTMPGDIVLPAGMILMARASEFLNQSGLAQITDDDFEEAAHIFSVKIMDTYDPEFRNKMQQHSGQQGQEQPMPPEQQGSVPQPNGALLNMTGQGV